MTKTEERVTHESLLPAALKKALAWEEENECFFRPSRFIEFGVRSKLAPQLVEDFFIEEVVFPLARKTKAKKQLLLPRKHTKSSIAKALCCFLLCDHEANIWGKQIRINFCGETKSFAIRSVKATRKALETNKYILREFGAQKPTKETTAERVRAIIGPDGDPEGLSPPEWTQSAFRTNTCVQGEIETGIVNEEPSMWADGVDVSSTGLHMDVVIFDDLVGGNSYRSTVKKDKAEDLYDDKCDQIMSTGWMLDIGTIWAEDDIHRRIAENHYESFDFVVHTIWGTGPELEADDFEKGPDGIYRVVGNKADDAEMIWYGFEQLTDEVTNGYLLPEEQRREMAFHWAAKIMLEDKKGKAASWAKQYLNRVIASEDQLYHDWMFKPYPVAGLPRLNKYILTDSATGRDNRSSYRVVATVGKDANDVAYLIDLDFGRWEPRVYVEKILEHWLRYAPKKLVFEKVSWQDSFKLNVEQMCELRGLEKPRVAMVTGRSLESKLERMEAAQPRYVNGRFLWNPKLKEKTCDDKEVWGEAVAQFKRVHELEQVRGLILDIPDALSDIDATDKDGRVICKPPRSRANARTPNTAITAGDVMRPLRERRRQAREESRGGSLWGGSAPKKGVRKEAGRRKLW